MRGTERSVEVTGWYKKPHLSEEFYMAEVDRTLKKFPNAKVFLATDTQITVNKFRAKYSDKLITYDAKRSDEGNSPHLQFGGAELGEQVLIESVLLSKTDFLIHGISNVAFAALCFNPNLPHKNIYSKHGQTEKLRSHLGQHFKAAIEKISRRAHAFIKK